MTKQHENSSFADAIVETIAQPLLALDGDLRVEMANEAFLRQFEVSSEKIGDR